MFCSDVKASKSLPPTPGVRAVYTGNGTAVAYRVWRCFSGAMGRCVDDSYHTECQEGCAGLPDMAGVKPNRLTPALDSYILNTENHRHLHFYWGYPGSPGFG
jgi:hypothetical protein